MSTGPIDRMMCRWAETKYGLENVSKVTFELDARGPYSDETPDVDPYVRVTITYADGKTLEREECYATNLIREILAYGQTPT